MRIFLTFLFTLLSTAIFCQPSLRTDYSLFNDTCPNPAKYRIASRTMYTTCTDSVRYCADDTTTEYYDRNGNLIAEISREPDLHRPNLLDLREHYFFYDSKGKIIRDSSIYNGKLHIQEYVYFPSERRAVINESEFGSRSTTTIRYNENNEEISRCTVNEPGDTTLIAYAHGDTFTHVQYLYYEGNKVTQDSISEIRHGNTVSRFISYPSLSNNESTTRVKYYDKQGRLTGDVQYYNITILSDSAHLAYDKKGRLIRRTQFFPKVNAGEDVVVSRTWISEYTYNKKGQLIEIRTSEKNNPLQVYTTRYVYNEKGLRIAEQSLVRNEKSQNVLLTVRRWEYGYY